MNKIKQIVIDNKLTIINYLLMAICFVFGSYLVNGKSIFFMDSNGVTDGPIPLHIFFIGFIPFLLCYIALIVINVIFNKYKPAKSFLIILGILFLTNLIALLTAKNSYDISFTGIDRSSTYQFTYNLTPVLRFEYIMEFLVCLIMTHLVFDVVYKVVDGHLFLKCACIVGLLLCLGFMIFSYISEADKYIAFFKNIESDPYSNAVSAGLKSKNNYAFILTVGLFSCFYMYMVSKKKIPFIYIAIFLYINIIFTLCKFLIILDLLVLTYFAIFSLVQSIKQKDKNTSITIIAILGLFLTAILAVLIVLLAKGKLVSIFENIFLTKGYNTLDTRSWIWNNTIQIINKFNWFNGVGYQLFGDLLYKYNMTDPNTMLINQTKNAHSVYLESLADGGIVLLLLSLIIIGYVIYLGVKHYRSNKILVIHQFVVIAFMLLYGIIENGPFAITTTGEKCLFIILTFIPLLLVNYETSKNKIYQPQNN